jgi:Mn2+/Fe2+ NRAMP family transporter
MGCYKAPVWVSALAASVALILIALNIKMLLDLASNIV